MGEEINNQVVNKPTDLEHRWMVTVRYDLMGMRSSTSGAGALTGDGREEEAQRKETAGARKPASTSNGSGVNSPPSNTGSAT